MTTGIDMALAMVAHDLDAAIAGEVAKRLVLYARRPGYQSQFSPVLQAQTKADSPFADLIAWILANLDARLDVPSLADRAGLSERTFHRKFVAATGETPARFVETARLDAARMLLVPRLPLKSVAAQVGLVAGGALLGSVRAPVRRRPETVPRHACRALSRPRQTTKAHASLDQKSAASGLKQLYEISGRVCQQDL